jgi:ribosomal protein S18 acetylase RimI-like enzyme
LRHLRGNKAPQVRIITLDGSDIGWLQSFVKGNELFLAQLSVHSALRRQGIGTDVVKGLIEEAARAGQPVTLGVAKTNPALRLYERLGFHTTHEDELDLPCCRYPQWTLRNSTMYRGQNCANSGNASLRRKPPIHRP